MNCDIYLPLEIGLFLLMAYHCSSKLQVLFLAESIECQNNFLVATKLMKLGSCDKAVKISGGAKGAEQTYKRLVKKPLKYIKNLFYSVLVSHIWNIMCFNSAKPTVEKFSKEQFFHQRVIFCQISNVCRDVFYFCEHMISDTGF